MDFAKAGMVGFVQGREKRVEKTLTRERYAKKLVECPQGNESDEDETD